MTEKIRLKRFNYATRQRFEFIELRLYNQGFVNRKHLIEKFEISSPQATRTIQDFIKLYPDSMSYNPSARYYQKMMGFKFNITGEAADAPREKQLLAELKESEELLAEFAVLFTNTVAIAHRRQALPDHVARVPKILIEDAEHALVKYQTYKDGK